MKVKARQILKKISPRWRTRKIKEHPEILKWIVDSYPNIALNIAIDCIVNNQSPYCVVCADPIKTLGKKTCSNVCGSKTVDFNQRDQKTKQTLKDNPDIIKKSQEKRIATLEQKYGAKVSPVTRQKAQERANLLNSKGRNTLRQRHGVTNPGQLKNHRTKCKQTLLENYGTDIYFNSEVYKSQRLETNKARYQILSQTVEITEVAAPNNLTQFKNPNLRISFKCEKCNNTETLPSETWKWRHREFGDPCAKCNNLLNGSNQENQVRLYITQELGYTTIDNYKLPNKKEIDIFIPSLNIGFEYDGLYWHSDARLDQNYHLEKTNYCAAQGIQLFHIFEDEWLYSTDIVKSRIQFILRKTHNRIYARNCTVKEINSTIANKFLKENHLQGVGRSNIKIGLFHNEQLVSVMTFLKDDISKKLKGWELNRFCSKLNHSIVGAANKLFLHFVKRYNPDTIVSFSDRRWSQKKSIYSLLGFEFKYNTKPNYWYFLPKDTKRIHRYSLRKPQNSILSERQLRQQQGYLRIYDCGSSKWQWSRKKTE